MPVKWTPETDQIVRVLPTPRNPPFSLPLTYTLEMMSIIKLIHYIQLLLKILETSEVSPKYAEIAAKWRKSLSHNFSLNLY